jgi:hypothetical protein
MCPTNNFFPFETQNTSPVPPWKLCSSMNKPFYNWHAEWKVRMKSVHWKRKQGTKLIFSCKFVLSRVSPPDLDFPYLHLTLTPGHILSLNQSPCQNKILQFFCIEIWYPVSWNSTQFFHLKNTLKFGIKQGIREPKLGPKDRVTLWITLVTPELLDNVLCLLHGRLV